MGSSTSMWGSEGWAAAGSGVLLPQPSSALLAHQETWTLTGLARHPSAWAAARGGTRSSRGASVGMAAAAGWATNPSAEVKPGGRTGDPGRAAGLCATLRCVRASTWGHSLGHPQPCLGDPGVAPVARTLPRLPSSLVDSELRAARGGF